MTRQLQVLNALRRPATARYVAARLGCTMSAASTAICRLSKRGLLTRNFIRVRNLYRLTEKGRAELELTKGAP